MEFVGKHLLIGITFLDACEHVIDQFQTHGSIIAIDEERGITVEKADGSGRYTLPPDIGNLYAAAPGEYRLRATGEIVVNPDLTSSWTVIDVKEGDMEELKMSGFGGLLS